MASLNAVVLGSKEAKRGRNKVRISVAHNGGTRYIVTDIILNSSKEFKNGIVVKRPDANILNAKIRGLLQRYQSALDELEYIDGLNCRELVYLLKSAGNYKHRALNSIFEEYIDRARVKQSTIDLYQSIWKVISTYIDGNMIAEHVNHGIIIKLDKSLRRRGVSMTTLRNYLSLFMSIINYAKKCGYVQYRVDPFSCFQMPEAEVRDCWLTVEEIRRIRDLQTSRKNICMCRDFFMLSYYLGGINITDLLNINFNEQVNTIRYIRKKTENRHKLNKFVEFRIPDEAKDIISKYKGTDGMLTVSRQQRINNMRYFFLLNMKKLARLVGIKRLIYYSARKSFSQHAFNLGISTGIIDYILGHRVDKGGSSLYNYISVTPELATAAVRKVLDNLK